MKRVLLLLFLFTCAVCCVFAQTFESGGIQYVILSSADKTVAVERYCGDSVGSVIIPKTVRFDDEYEPHYRIIEKNIFKKEILPFIEK